MAPAMAHAGLTARGSDGSCGAATLAAAAHATALATASIATAAGTATLTAANCATACHLQ